MPMTAEDLLVKQAPTLCANDRCDRCGAQAYTGWVEGARIVEGEAPDPQLLLCAHHTKPHADALGAQDFVMVVDEREKLLVERVSSADV
jgi:hypothetical protein